MTRKQSSTEIQSAAIYRCTDKVTQDVCYLVKSDSQAGVFYAVRFDQASARWSCECPAHKPCKHERAVQEVLKIRYEREQKLAEAEVIAPLVLGEQFAADLPAHVEDSIRSDEFVDPFAGMSKAERMQAYRAMYPDDFYSAA